MLLNEIKKVKEAKQRKTKDVHIIQGHYARGWEDVTEEDNVKDAIEMLKTYRENDPQHSYRRIVRREKIQADVKESTDLTQGKLGADVVKVWNLVKEYPGIDKNKVTEKLKVNPEKADEMIKMAKKYKLVVSKGNTLHPSTEKHATVEKEVDKEVETKSEDMPKQLTKLQKDEIKKHWSYMPVKFSGLKVYGKKGSTWGLLYDEPDTIKHLKAKKIWESEELEENWVKASSLSKEQQQDLLRAYVHRYTGDHKPNWVEDIKKTPVQFANDKEWLDNTMVKITKKGNLHKGVKHVHSNPTWPNNPELRKNVKESEELEEVKSVSKPIDIGNGFEVKQVGFDVNGNWSYWVRWKGQQTFRKIQVTNIDGGSGKVTDVKEFATGSSNAKKAIAGIKSYVKNYMMKKNGSLDESTLNELAVSSAQQRLFGMALAYKRGELDTSKVTKDLLEKIKKMVNSMTEKQLKDYASTSHKDLPSHVQERWGPSEEDVDLSPMNIEGIEKANAKAKELGYENLADLMKKNTDKKGNPAGPHVEEIRNILGKKKKTNEAVDKRFKEMEEGKKVIRISYSTSDEESREQGDAKEHGWEDEEGVDMSSDDEEETAVDNAVDFLKRKGAHNASSGSFHKGVWYSDDGDTNYRTGEDTVLNYHLSGFTADEEREIYNKMHGKSLKESAQVGDHAIWQDAGGKKYEGEIQAVKGDSFVINGKMVKKSLIKTFSTTHDDVEHIEMEEVNLDDMDEEDLSSFIKKNSGPLVKYAKVKLEAIKLRKDGKIEDAKKLENKLDDMYAKLPKHLRTW